MKRVIITNAMVGICYMQVCAESDATDEEILAECRRQNPSGTTNNWVRVIREDEPPSEFWPVEKLKPIVCGEYPTRKHIIVSC